MRVEILYFSGTGATAKLANMLGSALHQQTHTVDYLRITRNAKFEINQYDLLGIGAPAYSFRAPRMVTRFLRRLNWHHKPFFVFCISGGMPGNTIRNIFDAVKRNRGIFLGNFAAVATTNLRSWMPPKFSSTPFYSGLGRYWEPAVINFITDLTSHLGRDATPPNPPSKNYGTSLWSIFFTWRWQMALTAGIKRVDRQKCNRCGICSQKICPSGAITQQPKSYPKINEFMCVGCNGCVNLCPQDAIWSLRTRNHAPYTAFQDYILNSNKPS